jgi:hypothetical protein
MKACSMLRPFVTSIYGTSMTQNIIYPKITICTALAHLRGYEAQAPASRL